MRNLLSRYRPHYIRALVYMLQASEYNIRDYLSWYHRTRDFNTVEKRKKLQKTPKALALLLISWTITLIAACIIIVGIWTDSAPRGIVLALPIALPFVLPYLLAITALVLRAVQWPIEQYITSKAARILAKHPGIKIGIAGSFGKTSMREILKTVLAEGKKVAAPPGSFNTPLGVSQFVKTLSGHEDIIIFELGEYYRGDVRKLCKLINPHVGIITGVNEAHLERFKTIDETRATIFELAEYVKGKPVFINGESALAREDAAPNHILYTRFGVEDWKVQDPQTNLQGTSFSISRGGASFRVSSKLLGLHTVGPLALAADIAERLGLAISQIQSGISKTKPFEHRLELREEAWLTILDDSYNGNPDGVRAAIEFLSELAPRRRVYVTPGLVEMGVHTEEVHKEIGRQLACAGIEKVVLIRNSVTPYIEQGLKEASFKGELSWFDDGPKAYSALHSFSLPGDIVLLQNDWPDQYA